MAKTSNNRGMFTSASPNARKTDHLQNFENYITLGKSKPGGDAIETLI